MKIFISWSGTSSRLVAEALSDWLQRVIQAVEPFYSNDIDKGATWSNAVEKALEGTRFGIVCLTPDNLESNWIHYEAGALSKTPDASIWTFLLELKPTDVKQPLGRFQHTLAEKNDMLKMLKSINTKLVETGGNSLRESLLEEIFEETWTKLETRLNKAKESIKTQSNNENNKLHETVRKETDKLDEILEILRTMQRKTNEIPSVLNEAALQQYLNSSYQAEIVYPRFSFELPIPKESAEKEIRAISRYIINSFGKAEIALLETENGYKFKVGLLSPATYEKILNEIRFIAGMYGYEPPPFFTF